MKSFVLAAGLLLASALVVQAQPTTSPNIARSSYSTAAYYRYATPEDLTIRVNVWGGVRFPGYYEVPRGTTLSTLLSLTGGPVYADRRVGDEHTLLLKLTRGSQVVLSQQTVNNALVVEADVALQEGDVVTVEGITRPRSTWRDYAPIVSAGASLLSALVVIVVNLSR